MRLNKLCLVMILAALFSGSIVIAQEKATEKLGNVHFPVSCSAAAQKEFDRAVALLHNFWFQESDKAFATVAQADPSCAMAYWGIAMGQRLNPISNIPNAAALKKGWATVLDDPDAFQKVSAVQQQRWLDNGNTLALSYADAGRALSVTCEQLGTLKVPALVITGEKSRANFRYSNEMLVSCLPKNTATAVVPNAPHNWFAANPDAAAKAILAFIRQH